MYSGVLKVILLLRCGFFGSRFTGSSFFCRLPGSRLSRGLASTRFCGQSRKLTTGLNPGGFGLGGHLGLKARGFVAVRNVLLNGDVQRFDRGRLGFGYFRGFAAFQCRGECLQRFARLAFGIQVARPRLSGYFNSFLRRLDNRHKYRVLGYRL